MKKVIVQPSGGLGNQMFQYAAAYGLAKKNSAELVVDYWSGFYRDHEYKREYELELLPISARRATKFEILKSIIFRIYNKKSGNMYDFTSFFNEDFIFESNQKYLPEIVNYSFKRSLYVSGHFQSEKYFSNNRIDISREFCISNSSKLNFNRIGERMRQQESVAIGIRLYEESKDPMSHAKERKRKYISDINKVIDKILSKHRDAIFYIFCTHNSNILQELNLTNSAEFILHDNGFEGTIDRLWLLSQCKHHVFNNSSFYWWGAWLSQFNYIGETQSIYAADNFINVDSIPDNWELF